MRKIAAIAAWFIICVPANTQTIQNKLDEKVKRLLADGQMKHAMMGFHVVNAKTGKTVYDLNGEVGLAPASTQKIFTSIAALDTLGRYYRFKTDIGYTGEIMDSMLYGNLIIVGYGDPSFGSWRYPGTKMEEELQKIAAALHTAGIRKINGDIVLNDSKFSYQSLPGGWPWQDIGNYYGAGVWGINWNENQYDLIFKAGDNEGDSTTIVETNPVLLPRLDNEVKTGPRGSGDQSNIYLAPYGATGITDGTVPAGEKRFIVSGSMAYPADVFGRGLADYLQTRGIALQGSVVTGYKMFCSHQNIPGFTTGLLTVHSPQLDSLVYWFLQKSINFYGETFAATIAYEATGFGSIEKGVDMIRNYWESKGIEKSSVKMIDGSGLSPQNRVTTTAEVSALQYAKNQPWFSSFYNALPTYNGTKMKSGTIGGVKAFAGYQTSAGGSQYIFSIIINNYNGSTEAVIKKMFEVLDVLK